MNDRELDLKLVAMAEGHGRLAGDLKARLEADVKAGSDWQQVLIDKNVLTSAEVNRALEEATGCTALDPTKVALQPEFMAHVAPLLGPEAAAQHLAFPLKMEINTLHLAMANPTDEERLAASPVIADGRVFVIDSLSVVSAYDAGNGKRLWKRDLTPDEDDEGHIAGGIAYDGGRIYISTGFAEAIALEAQTGAEIWRQRISSPARAAPTVRGGRVFVLTVDNKVFAINAKNGETLWTHTGAAETASLLGSASPAVSDGVVVVPYTNGDLVALKVDSGRPLWQDSLSTIKRTDVLSNLAHIRGRPVIDRGRVFAISHAGLMAAYDLRSGRRLWQKEVGGLESPWVAGDYIFLLTNDSEIAALSRDTGRIHWVRSLPRYEDPENQEDPIIWTGPILVSDRLIAAGSHGLAIAVSPYTGRILGSVELPDGISVPPVVAGASVYFLADNAKLVAYR